MLPFSYEGGRERGTTHTHTQHIFDKVGEFRGSRDDQDAQPWTLKCQGQGNSIVNPLLVGFTFMGPKPSKSESESISL